jgi:hypothetical protein
MIVGAIGLIWAPRSDEIRVTNSLVADPDGGPWRCETRSGSSTSRGLFKYYEALSDHTETGRTAERSVVHGWRLAGTVLLTVVIVAAAAWLWVLPRRLRSRRPA